MAEMKNEDGDDDDGSKPLMLFLARATIAVKRSEKSTHTLL